MRRCPFTNCDKTVPDNIFACRGHWFSLNKGEQAEIYASYGDYTAGIINVEELRDRQQAILGLRGSAFRSDA